MALAEGLVSPAHRLGELVEARAAGRPVEHVPAHGFDGRVDDGPLDGDASGQAAAVETARRAASVSA
jgi:hypothetical protein